jgi:hypothetical protein
MSKLKVTKKLIDVMGLFLLLSSKIDVADDAEGAPFSIRSFFRAIFDGDLSLKDKMNITQNIHNSRNKR